MTRNKLEGVDNVFLLGLGHQKCGTTWLHSYLSQSPSFDGGFEKEYHIWDSLDVACSQSKLLTWVDIIKGRNQRKRYKMQRSDAFYFDYFDSLYKNDITLSADITPFYSSLGVSRLGYIKKQFAQRNIIVKPVILIRDPINRIKSAVRFNLDRNRYCEGVKLGETNFLRALSQYYKSEDCLLRTSYNKTISNAYSIFGESDVYVGIYESMFDIAEIERFSEFVGVPVKGELANVYVNKTKNQVEEDLALESEIKKAYSDVYEYCYDKFPNTKSLWRG